MPDAILERPKVGFRVPVNEWFRGPMSELPAATTCTAPTRARARYYDAAGARPHARRPHRGPAEPREAAVDAAESRDLAPPIRLTRLSSKLALEAEPPALHDAGGDRPSRAARAAGDAAERSGFCGARDVPAPDLGRRAPQPWIHAEPRVERARPTLAAAERIAAGRLDVFALRGRRARLAAALEPRPEDRHRGAARLRQAARLPRPATWSATASTCGSPTATCTW